VFVLICPCQNNKNQIWIIIVETYYYRKGATQKSCTIFLALKGRNIPAQGSALGKYKKEFLAL